MPCLVLFPSSVPASNVCTLWSWNSAGFEACDSQIVSWKPSTLRSKAHLTKRQKYNAKQDVISDRETQFLQWNVLSLARTVETSALLQHLSESVQRPSETCTHCQAKFWSLQTCSSCEAEQRRGKAIECDGMDQTLKFKDDNPNSTNDIPTYCQFGCWALEPASTGNPWHRLHSPRDPKTGLYRNITVGSDPTVQKWSEVMLQRGSRWSPNQKEACSGNASNFGIKHWEPSKKKMFLWFFEEVGRPPCLTHKSWTGTAFLVSFLLNISASEAICRPNLTREVSCRKFTSWKVHWVVCFVKSWV